MITSRAEVPFTLLIRFMILRHHYSLPKIKAFRILFWLSFIFCIIADAQTTGNNQLIFNKGSYSIFTVKVDSSTLKRFKLVQNLAGVSHNDFISPYIKSDPNIFITNGCIWDTLYKPIGLFISERKIINPLNLNDGNQMGFYLKPNGVFIISDSDAVIMESSKASNYMNCSIAVQSGPMLVIDGEIHAKFAPNSKNKYFRCGVGIYTDNAVKYLVFAASNEPVTLYEFAMLFKDYFRCKYSLCLQSAGCVMYTPFIDRKNPIDNNPVANYIIYVNHD